MEWTQAILTTKTLMNGLTGLLQDISGFLRDPQLKPSWSRFCSLVCLAEAILAQHSGGDVAHISVWLGAAFGTYSVGKVKE